jgi:hypothetical protein
MYEQHLHYILQQLIVYHLYRINCLGGIGNFATKVTNFDNLFTGINLRFLVLNSNFQIPFFELILTMMDICDTNERLQKKY